MSLLFFASECFLFLRVRIFIKTWRSRVSPRAAHLTALKILRLLNLKIEFDGFAPVVGELQIHYRPILELKVRYVKCARFTRA